MKKQKIKISLFLLCIFGGVFSCISVNAMEGSKTFDTKKSILEKKEPDKTCQSFYMGNNFLQFQDKLKNNFDPDSCVSDLADFFVGFVFKRLFEECNTTAFYNINEKEFIEMLTKMVREFYIQVISKNNLSIAEHLEKIFDFEALVRCIGNFQNLYKRIVDDKVYFEKIKRKEVFNTLALFKKIITNVRELRKYESNKKYAEEIDLQEKKIKKYTEQNIGYQSFYMYDGFSKIKENLEDFFSVDSYISSFADYLIGVVFDSLLEEGNTRAFYTDNKSEFLEIVKDILNYKVSLYLVDIEDNKYFSNGFAKIFDLRLFLYCISNIKEVINPEKNLKFQGIVYYTLDKTQRNTLKLFEKLANNFRKLRVNVDENKKYAENVDLKGKKIEEVNFIKKDSIKEKDKDEKLNKEYQSFYMGDGFSKIEAKVGENFNLNSYISDFADYFVGAIFKELQFPDQEYGDMKDFYILRHIKFKSKLSTILFNVLKKLLHPDMDALDNEKNKSIYKNFINNFDSKLLMDFIRRSLYYIADFDSLGFCFNKDFIVDCEYNEMRFFENNLNMEQDCKEKNTAQLLKNIIDNIFMLRRNCCKNMKYALYFDLHKENQYEKLNKESLDYKLYNKMLEKYPEFHFLEGKI